MKQREAVRRAMARGATIEEAAAEARCTPAAAMKYWAAILREIATAVETDLDGMRAASVEALRTIYREAMEAWERSKGPKVKKAKRSGDKGEEQLVELREGPGDALLLDQARKAQAELTQLIGVRWAHKTPQPQPAAETPGPTRLRDLRIVG